MWRYVITLSVWLMLGYTVPCSAAVLYNNPFNAAADLNDWSFYGADSGNWQIGTQSVTINNVANNLNGLSNPGGWGTEKYAVLNPPLDLLDARVRAQFNTTGNNNGYVAFELRKTGAADEYRTGITFQIHRYHMLIFDGATLLSSNVFFGVGNPRFDGMNTRGLFTLDAFVRDNQYSASILFQSDQGHVYHLTNQFGHATMSGTLVNALDSGNTAIRYMTHEASPFVYGFQILDAPVIPEPSTLALLMLGFAALRRLSRNPERSARISKPIDGERLVLKGEQRPVPPTCAVG